MYRRLVITVCVIFGVTGADLRAQSPVPATGDQSFEYVFPPTGETMPYRVYVPTSWDGETALPIILFLHGAGANERSYLDMADGLLPEGTAVISLWRHREEHGYPTPFLGRDGVVDPLLAGLDRLAIHSRGRFGGWKYEVSNMDHSVMQGVEWATRMVKGDEETTYSWK